MRVLIGAFFLLHAVAHLVGVTAAWELGARVPPRTTYLGGRLELGERGARVLGALWLLAAMAFVATAAAVWTFAPSWTALAAGAAAFSLLLSILAWPESWIGVWINLGILAGLLLLGRLQGLA